MSESEEIERLLERAADADADAVDGLLLRYRKRLGMHHSFADRRTR